MLPYFLRQPDRGKLLVIPIFLALVPSLAVGQSGTPSRQTQWSSDEASAAFVFRQEPERRPIVRDDQSFSSNNGTPIAVVEAQSLENAIRQPYRSVDQVFYDHSRPGFEGSGGGQTLTLVPQSTYSHDAREWVEMYHTAGRSEWDLFSSNQVTPTAGLPQHRPAAAEPSPKTAHSVRIDHRIAENLDLTPNPAYAKHLRYTDVCGVVVVQSNFPLTEIRRLLDEIALLQHDLNQYMAIPAPKEKIELCLFRDEASYIRFLRDVFPRAPLDRRALYVKEPGKPGVLLVQRTKDFEIDLRHEMTHAVIHASIANVPIWLDEGLAKYFEPPPEERAAMNPYLKQVRRNIVFGAVPSLGRLEKLEHIGDMGSREYRDSWAWVHFLIHHSPQTHRLLAGYLQMLAALSERQSDAKMKVAIPPISLYLEDVVPQPREKYLEHFKTWAVADKDDE